MGYRIKNWGEYQSYKDGRNLIWIRLYKRLLDDDEWHKLSGWDAKYLVMLWLLASEKNGNLPTPNKISFRLRITDKQATELLSALSHWVERYEDGLSQACDETEKSCHIEEKRIEEKRIEEIKTLVRPDQSDVMLQEDFLLFWDAYPKHEGRKKAHDRWTRMTLHDRLAAIAGLRRWKDSGRWGDLQFVPLATTYLNGRRWEDEIAKFGGGDGQFVNKREQAQRATIEAAKRTMERHSDEISGQVLAALPSKPN